MNAEQLKQRTKQFAVRIIGLVDALPRTAVGRVIGEQVMKSGSSVGANYRACCWARSRAEFIAKMSIVVEEADETAWWLELVIDAGILPGRRVQPLLNEANELLAIFSRSRATARRNRTRRGDTTQ